MTSSIDVQESAEAITEEIGPDTSYFTDESERNFTGLELAMGYLLLHWFIEGVVTGAGEAVGEAGAKQVKRGAVAAIGRLRDKVRTHFGRRNATPDTDAAAEKELAAETKAALADAPKALATVATDGIGQVADTYEQALVGYLCDNGMPPSDAMRVAQKVRQQAGIQLRLKA